YDNIMPFIHLPVQSGDSEILRIMGRRYTREQYVTLFHKIKDRLPNCAFSTDIIVGFPNESDEQFQHTLELVDECHFDNAFTFIYSPREGTPAARMEDNIPLAIKQERLQILNNRWNAYAKIDNDAYLGRNVKVLVDGFSKKNKEVLSGYTETNKLVNFRSDSAKIGDIVEVKIVACKTFSLDGEEYQK
ncbi:MAG: TRAM domain-containing protein, partial [Longicatena sp.]